MTQDFTDDNITPHEVDCFGYECHDGAYQDNKSACLELITSILWGIEQGDKIPPLNMFHFLDAEYNDQYELIYPVSRNSISQDGGHHRLLAHFLGKHDMNIKLYTTRICNFGVQIPDYISVNTKHMMVESRPDVFRFQTSYDANYRIPERLQNPARRPTSGEVCMFLADNKYKALTSQDILRSLYK